MTRTHLLIHVFFLQFLVIKGQFNATYGFINVGPGTGTVDPGPFPQQEGVIFRPFTAQGVSSQPAASGRFAYSAWPLGATNGQDSYLNFTGDLSGLAYYETTIRVLDGYELELTNLNFNVRRSGTGIRNYAVKCSSNNYSSNLSASTGTNTNLLILPGDLFFWKYDSLSTANDQKGSVVSISQRVSDSITFRFYAWNAEATGGSFSIDNVTFSGKITDLNHPQNISKLADEKNLIQIYYKASSKTVSTNCYLEGNWIVSNLAGTIVKKEERCADLEVHDLKEGLYIVRCRCAEQIFWRKIFIAEN